MSPRLALLCLSISAITLACQSPAGSHVATGGRTGASVQPAADLDLRTVAEKSNFTKTARYDEVVGLLDAMAKASPLARRAEMGKTVEGRSIPMLIVSDPPVATPEEAAEQSRKGKLVALLLANIHSGEVDGKEGLPILAREIITTKDHPLLKDYVLIFAPIFNADGNEKLGNHRPGQNAPAEVGVRENAKGLDLNRDFTKLESPEVRSLVRAFNAWDPHIFVDCHTTNGSYHRYVLTYEGPRNPAGNAKLIEYVRDTMMPAVTQTLSEKLNRKVFPYGDFNEDHTKWESFPAQARFATNYFGLRNRLAILSEGYAYASLEDRVLGTRDFVRACLEYAGTNKDTVKKTLAAADAATINAGRNPPMDEPRENNPNWLVTLRSKPKAAPAKVTALGFVEEKKDGKTINTGTPKDYEVELWTHFEPTLSVARPFAYLIPSDRAGIVENLQRHGIEVEELREDLELDGELLSITEATTAEREFQGHKLRNITTSDRAESRRFAAGTLVVRTAQKLGSLAVCLLEPAGEDSLATWNYFDDAVKAGADFPIMRVPHAATMLTARVRALPEDRPEQPKPITFEAAYERDELPGFSGNPTGGFQWLDDGEHYYQFRDGKLRKVNAKTGRAEVAFDPAPIAKALATLPTIGEKRAADLANGARFTMNAARTGAYFNVDNDLYFASVDGKVAKRLTSTPEAEELVSWSPNGEFLAFVRKFDLHVVDVKTATERALTTGGTENLRRGIADWVYEEEIYGRGAPRTYWWSPDSSRLAFLEIDNSMVRDWVITNDLNPTQVVEHYRYPRPGEPNPRARLGVVTAAGAGPFWADMSGYEIDNHLITAVSWWPDSSQVWCAVQNRIQSWADICAVGASGGAPNRLFRETTKAWVDTPPNPVFFKDGSFLFTSERSGYRHLYKYTRDGQLVSPLTGGNWEIRGTPTLDESGGHVYFNATKDNPIATSLYRTKLAAAGDEAAVERLTPDRGAHGVTISPKFNFITDSWSSRESPTKVVLRTMDGKIARVLDTNPVHALADYRFGKSEQFQVTLKDGFQCEASWVLPPDFDESRKYPVWFMTYAGPQAPSVSDSWGGGQVWDNVLASAGIIAFRADPKGASAKGAISAWPSYKQLGVTELSDIVEIMTWLRQKPWVDGSRIGMSGFSFGGYITAYAMTHSDVFAAGIAGGSVTDWREYDTLYTERFMSTPQDNPDGYDRTSVLKGAGNLKGRLMILHGLIDENVHAANSWKLARALQQAGKQFDMMFYPGNRHGVFGAQYQRFQFDFITKNLKPESALGK